MTRGDTEALLAGLDPDQRAVATTLEGPVAVIAGAGTGKTRALTHRIAYGVRTGVYDPSAVLAVTFTTRAAAELRARLAHLGVPGVATRTFHSAALSQVRYLWPRLYDRPFPTVMDDPQGLVSDLADAAGLPASPRDLVTEISWAKVSNVAPHAYVERAAAAGRRVAGARAVDVARLYAAYVDALAGADRVDLEDVLLAAVGMLSTQPAAARVVRSRYRWFTVDEFQDVSALQMRLLECWLGEGDDVCVVGDPHQAIYRFAGAHPSLLETFAGRFPGTRALELSRSYRCTANIVATAGAVLPPVRPLVPPTGGPPPAAQAATRHRPLLRSVRTDGARVLLLEAADQQAEAASVADQVRRLVEGGTAERDIAVLTRTRAHAQLMLRALQEAGVSVTARGATPFYERPEARQAVALLAAASRREAVAGSGAHDDGGPGPARGSLDAVVRAVLVDAGWTPDRPERSPAVARWETWAAVVRLARDADAAAAGTGGAPPTLAEFVDDLREQARAGVQPPGAGVTVATLHATKGQEWSAVFVAGVHDGGIPNAAALARTAGTEALSEEQRLLYVGMTRAADHLCLSWARHADRGGSPRRPSRFLARLLRERPATVDIRLQPGAPAA